MKRKTKAQGARRRRGRATADALSGAPGESEPTRIRISSPEDFVAIVPYLLGFHPSDSLVALFFADGRVVLTARLDLPGSARCPFPMSHVADQLAKLAVHPRGRPAAAGRGSPTSVVLLCYTDRVETWPAFAELAADPRLDVLEALQVGPRRWRSLVCTDDGCCPPEGTAYDLSDHPMAAEAVWAGLSAAPDRESLADWVAGPPAADAEWLAGLAADAYLDLAVVSQETRRRLIRHRVEQSLARPGDVSDAECAELAALCLDVEVRDVAWALMTREHIGDHIALWRRVVARTADPFTPGPLGLESVAAWIGGNGALLNCGIERLHALAPNYGLLSVLEDLSWRAVPPSFWDELGADLRRQLEPVAP